MNKKKGYGIVIPIDWSHEKWAYSDAAEIITDLKRLTRDAFYRMAEDVKIDILRARV